MKTFKNLWAWLSADSPETMADIRARGPDTAPRMTPADIEAMHNAEFTPEQQAGLGQRNLSEGARNRAEAMRGQVIRPGQAIKEVVYPEVEFDIEGVQVIAVERKCELPLKFLDFTVIGYLCGDGGGVRTWIIPCTIAQHEAFVKRFRAKIGLLTTEGRKVEPESERLKAEPIVVRLEVGGAK